MNVALCLSGLTRSVSWTCPLINRYLIDPFDADLFIHTWEEDHGGNRVNSLYNDGLAPSIQDGRTKKEFLKEEFHNLRALKLEKHQQWANDNNTFNSAKAMYYGIFESFNLTTLVNKKYDLVIRARMDSFFNTFIPENEIDDALQNNVVYWSLPGRQWGENYISDIFAFGNYSVMNHYANTWKEQLYHSDLPEELLTNQLKEKNIDTKWSEVKYKMTNEWGPNFVTVWSDEEDR